MPFASLLSLEDSISYFYFILININYSTLSEYNFATGNTRYQIGALAVL